MIVQKRLSSGLETHHILKEDLEITVIPGLGGKISSILWSGKEILAQNPAKPLIPARYAASYSDYDASGFDECIPTIGPCRYPLDPWKDEMLPDHGEVWSLPWEARTEGDCLFLHVRGIALPYLFEKKIEILEPGKVQLSYSLTNFSQSPLVYLWSSHPLIAPQPGMRIHLPEDTGVRVDWSKDGRLGELLAEHPWPSTIDAWGKPVDLSLILPPGVRLVDKLYTTRLSQGWCAVHDPASEEYIAFVFDPKKVPFVGLSINLGGWPVDESGQAAGYYNLGLEPCSGYPDRLDIAVAQGACCTMGPESTTTWELQLRVGKTKVMDPGILGFQLR